MKLNIEYTTLSSTGRECKNAFSFPLLSFEKFPEILGIASKIFAGDVKNFSVELTNDDS